MKAKKLWFIAVLMLCCIVTSTLGLAATAEAVYAWDSFTVEADGKYKLNEGLESYDLYVQNGVTVTLTADYTYMGDTAESITWRFINQNTGKEEIIDCTEPSYTFTYKDEGVLVFSSEAEVSGQHILLEKIVCLYEYSIPDLMNVEREFTANEPTKIWFMPEYLNPVTYKEYVAKNFIRDWNGDGSVTVDELNQNVKVSITSDVALSEDTTYEFTNEANMVSGRLCLDLGKLTAEDSGRKVTLTLENSSGEQFTVVYTLKHNGLSMNLMTVLTEANVDITESDEGIFVFTPKGATITFADGTVYNGSKDVTFTYTWSFYDYATYTETILPVNGKECELVVTSDGNLTCEVEITDSNGNILGWTTSEAVILQVDTPEEEQPEPPVWDGFVVYSTGKFEYDTSDEVPVLYLEKGALTIIEADYTCDPVGRETIAWYFQNLSDGEMETISCTDKTYLFTFENEGNMLFLSKDEKGTLLEKHIYLRCYQEEPVVTPEFSATTRVGIGIPKGISPFLNTTAAEMFIRDYDGDGIVAAEELNKNVSMSVTVGKGLQLLEKVGFTEWTDPADGTTSIDYAAFVFKATGLQAQDETVVATVTNTLGETYYHKLTVDLQDLVRKGFYIVSDPSGEIAENVYGNYDLTVEEGATITFRADYESLSGEEADLSYEWWVYSYDLNDYTSTEPLGTSSSFVETAPQNNCDYVCKAVSNEDPNVKAEVWAYVTVIPKEAEPEAPVWNGFKVSSDGEFELETEGEIPSLYVKKGTTVTITADYTCDPVGTEEITWYFYNVNTEDQEVVDCKTQAYTFVFENEGNLRFVSRDDNGLLIDQLICLVAQEETPEFSEFSATTHAVIGSPRGISPLLNETALNKFFLDYDDDGVITVEELNQNVTMTVSVGEDIQLREENAFTNWVDPVNGQTYIDYPAFVFEVIGQQAQGETIIATITNTLGEIHYHKLTVELKDLVRKGFSIVSSPEGELAKNNYGNYELTVENGATITFTPDYATLNGEEADLSYEWWAYSYDLGDYTSAEPLSTESVFVVTEPMNNCDYSCKVTSNENSDLTDEVWILVTVTPKESPDPAVWNGFTASADGEYKAETVDGIQYLYAEEGAQVTVTADYTYEPAGAETISWYFCDKVTGEIQPISSQEKTCTFAFEREGYLNITVTDSDAEGTVVTQNLYVCEYDNPAKMRDTQVFTENEVVRVYFDPKYLDSESTVSYVAEKFVRDWNGDGKIDVEELNENVKVSWVSEVQLMRNATTFKFVDKLNISSDETWLFEPGELQANLGQLTKNDDGKKITLNLENKSGDLFAATYELKWNGASTSELTAVSDNELTVKTGWDGSISVYGVQGSQVTFTDYTVFEGSEHVTYEYNWSFIEWTAAEKTTFDATGNECTITLEKNGNLFCDVKVIGEDDNIKAHVYHQATIYVEEPDTSAPVKFNVLTNPAAVDGVITVTEGEMVTISTNAVCDDPEAEIEFYWSIDTVDENGDYVSGEVQEGIGETFSFVATSAYDGKKVYCKAHQAGTDGHEEDDSLSFFLAVQPIDGIVIESEAFSGMAVTEVQLPENVKAIEERAFAGCAELQKVYFPNRYVMIAENAFAGCDNVCFYVYPNTSAEAFAIGHDIPVEYLED